jgi:hypothetical protein
LESKWSIAVYRGTTPFTLRPCGEDVPVLSPESVTDIKCKTVADPFLLRRDGVWYLFFEAWNGDAGRGEIGCATSADGMSWQYGGIVLRESFHLSYPHVFAHEGAVYMVPETRQKGSIRLYAATRFPDQWTLASVLAQGDYADSTLFLHEGKWRMFAQRGLDEMRVFQSANLESGWSEHPGNPFWAANRTYCRPGGRILNFDGAWYRFAQDGLVSYGNNLRALRIEQMSDEIFEEREIAASPILRASRRGWNALGMHHLDAVEIAQGEWLGVVDGVTFQ